MFADFILHINCFLYIVELEIAKLKSDYTGIINTLKQEILVRDFAHANEIVTLSGKLGAAESTLNEVLKNHKVY